MKNLYLFFTIVLLFSGCAAREEITNYSQITTDKPDQLYIFLKDSSLITLSKFTLIQDTIINGFGTREKNGISVFNGDINMSDIHYIAGESSGFFRGLATVALCGTVAGILLSQKDVNKGVSYDLKFPTGNYNPSSCPFLYSSNGKGGYVLEGEAFGTGLGYGMETSTAIVLKNSDNNSSEMKVRFTNERPETHYFNYIETDAIEHDVNSEIIVDNNENYIPVYSKTGPLEAVANGKDILSYINWEDKKLWVENIAPASGSLDTIYLAFDNIQKSNEATMIVNSINTYFGTYTYNYMNKILGDKYLEFMNCVESDPGVIQDLRGYLKESSLNIEVYNGRKWEYEGCIKPEANFTSFTKGIRVKIPEGAGSKLLLRLTALKDVWKIDNLSCDFTKFNSAPIHIQKIITAAKNNSENVLSKLNYDDNNYCVLLPNDKIDISFSPLQVQKGKKITYGVKAKGYLQPWNTGGEIQLNNQIVKIEEDKKIEFVKNLLKNRDYFLPVIYSEWEKDRYLYEK